MIQKLEPKLAIEMGGKRIIKPQARIGKWNRDHESGHDTQNESMT